jgi:phage gpG-like protein
MAVIARNLGAFTNFQERLDAVARGRFMPELATALGVAFIKQVADQFRGSRDPYGKPWAPVFRNRLRDRRARASRAKAGKAPRADKPLIDTGRLRASPVARVTGSDVRIDLPVEYASYHQYGTARMVRRQILPEAETGGLGPYWTAAANREAAVVMRKQFPEAK